MKEINEIFITEAQHSHRKPKQDLVSMPTSKSEHMTQQMHINDADGLKATHWIVPAKR